MTNLKNILTIAGLGLVTSLNAQNSEKNDSIYNNQGQLERVISKRCDNTNDTTNYKYDNNGKVFQKIKKSKEGTETTSYKYDEKGKKIEELFDLNWEHQKLKNKTIYEYDKQGKMIKVSWSEKQNDNTREIKSQSDYIYDSEGKLLKKIIQTDEDGDGIYEQQYECPCGSHKEAT